MSTTPYPPARAGWAKHPANPVLGGDLGTCFDIAVLAEAGLWRMFFSWRPQKAVALVESRDGVQWSEPRILLGPAATGWEDQINRPGILKRNGLYHLWYTGQTKTHSWIGHAVSSDLSDWRRESRPVLSPQEPWEKVAVMCPHVLWDGGQYRMWYSGGEHYEPNAIGHAVSPDGVTWTRTSSQPVFAAAPDQEWEKWKVTAGQVEKCSDWYVMFYIGFADEHTARIGLARSRDGLGGWQRHPANPILSPGTPETWDAEACYKPFALFDGARWRLWYNGRKKTCEQIGLAVHEGGDLGF